jgi:hypothetical protein
MVDNSVVRAEDTPVKVYVKPVIVHELKLETRAGSPLGFDPIDPLGLDPTIE